MLDPSMVEADTKLMLSGDFSFSYKPDQPEVDRYRSEFEKSIGDIYNDRSKCPKDFDETTKRYYYLMFA